MNKILVGTVLSGVLSGVLGYVIACRTKPTINFENYINDINDIIADIEQQTEDIDKILKDLMKD